MSGALPVRIIPVLSILLLGWSSAAQSTTFDQLSLEALTSHSSHVVRGQFIKTESQWTEDKSTIYTKVFFRVGEAIAGDVANSEIVVYLPGGTVGDTSTFVIGAPEITVGGDAVLMLSAVPETSPSARVGGAQAFNIVGLSQGVFDLKQDPETGKLRVTSQAAKFMRDAELEEGVIAGRSGAEGMTLEELTQRIREISSAARRPAAAEPKKPAMDEGEGEQGNAQEELGEPGAADGEEGEKDDTAREEGSASTEEAGEERTIDEGGKEQER